MSDQKSTWGGKRKGARRPLGKYPRQVLVITCTPEEKKLIMNSLSTRERAKALLAAVAVAE